jgi:hypothetical protein
VPKLDEFKSVVDNAIDGANYEINQYVRHSDL